MLKKLILCGVMAFASLGAIADEGMWVLHKIDPRTQQAMQQLGLKLSAQELYDPASGVSLKDAVVDFGDFCSGVVVSQDGLVFTNHHCGFGAIQSLSSTEDDILKNGFVSHSFAEDRPAEGLSVFFLQETIDITSRVKASVDSVRKEGTYTEEQLASEVTEKALTYINREYHQRYPNREVRVQAFFGGSEFYVSIYKEYKDVRLVFTPTQSLGKFGGDTDNWMWPRQTSDFSVFRIYADKNGEPAEYSKDNVPLRPKRWAKISLDGYAPGDYCMTIGFPGSTDRYMSSYGITQRMEQENKPRIEVRGLKQDVWTKWMKRERAIGIQYASKFASSSNYWKNSIGMNKALADLGVVAQKQQLEQRIQQWIDQDEARKARFGNALPTLQKQYKDINQLIRNVMYINETLSGLDIMRMAKLANDLSLQTDSAGTAAVLREIAEARKDFDVRVDEETAAVLLANMVQKVDTSLVSGLIKTVNTQYGGDYAAYVHDMYARTLVMGPNAERDIILAGKKIQDDPALKFRVEMRNALMPPFMEMSVLGKDIQHNENLLTQAFLEMDQQQPHYSDANFSMRLSYGIIQDYTAGGQHFQYYTNAQSILDKAAKQKEIEDYFLESDIVRLLQKGDFGRYADKRTKEMQLCFISNNDITGGNSGSPMFNGKGELIGLAFDGNWEAMSGDISFNPALQRCIGVDIRFVLYLMDKWGHADNLLKELGLK